MKPQPSEKTDKVYQHSCDTENMNAKFGVSLTNEQNLIRRYILSETPRIGRIPPIKTIQDKFPHISEREIYIILNHLNDVDVIHLNDDKKLIEAAYPFSGLKTPHIVKFKSPFYKDIYAMCAIDALGISFMFNANIEIISECFHCKNEINIEIENNEIRKLHPENVVVWCHMEYSCCAATSLCNNINFFSSVQHYKEWESRNTKQKGYLLTIQEAFYLGKLYFEKRL
ncbi:MAG: organomercurial lyase [Candidatus Thorarchaeota archaeon]